MNEVIKFGKKLFTFSVVAMTLVWSLGVSALVAAPAHAEGECPTVESGDLVKVGSSATVYSINDDLRRQVIPDEPVFYSWYKDFSTVKTIPENCLAQFPLAQVALTFRPGSALVKSKEAAATYLVLPGGEIAHIANEAVAKGLYGSEWNKGFLHTLPDIQLQAYVDNGKEISTPTLQNGMLVMKEGTTAAYYVMDGMLHPVDGTLSKITSPALHAVSAEVFASVEMSGTSVTEATVLARTGMSTTTPVVSGSLSASLSASTPASSLIAASTAFNPVLKVNVKAGSSAVTITGLKLKKTGFAGNTAVSGILVEDGSGVQHGNTVSSLTVDSEAELFFSANPIVVNAGTTQTLTFKFHADSSVTSGDIQFALTGVTTANSNDTVTGLPVTGNSFTMANGSSSVATAEVQLNSSYISDVNLGTTEVESFGFRVNEIGSHEDMYVDKVVLYQSGTASDSDYTNVKLYDKTGEAVATGSVSNRYVTFDMSANPVLVKKGSNNTFTVKMDVVSGAARTVRFQLQENDDLMLRGANTGAYVLPTGAGTDTSFPIGDSDSYNLISIASGTLTVSESATPTTNVAAGDTGVTIGRFLLKPTGENMELRKMKLALIQAGSTALTGNVYVKVNGSTVYSIAASNLATSSQSGISNAVTNATTRTMSTYYNMPADTDAIVEVVADVSSDAVSGDAYGAGIAVSEVKRVSTNDIVTTGLGANVQSTARSVSAATLKVVNVNWHAGTYNVVKSDAQTSLAKFTLDASSSGEDVRITSFRFTDTTGGTTPAVTDIVNLALYEDGSDTALLTSNSTSAISSTSSISFNLKTPLVISKDAAARTFYLKGDISSAATAAATHRFTVTSETAAVGVTTGNAADDVSGTAQTVTIAGSGTLNVAVSYASGDTYNENATVSVNATQEPFTVFTFKANDEDIKVKTLNLTATGTLVYTDFGNVSLYKDDAATPFATLAQCTTATTSNCGFSSSDALFTVPAGQTVKVRVKADISGEAGAALGHTLRFQIDSTSTDIDAWGVSQLGSGSKTGTPTVSYYKQIVPFGVNIVAVAPTGNSTVNVSNGTILGQFKVTNTGAAAVTVGSTSATTTLYDSGTSTSSLVYGLYTSDANSSNSATLVATTTASSGSLVFAGASGVTLQSGEYRTLSVKVYSNGANLTSGDTFQLSVSSIGDVTYAVTESALGYDGNADGTQSGSVTGLYVTGKPSLGTYTKQ